MPVYTLRNTDTEEVFELRMSLKEYDEYREKNPLIQRFFDPSQVPGFGDPVRLGLKKPDQGFRDRLREIQKAHPKGKVNTW
jgi:hypothetical protein